MWWRRVVSTLKQIAGMPDYERYLRHMRTTHPDQKLISPGEYTAEYLKRRYESGANRCC
jgi:uncharacterized short protein YbdD (DUF466 family)